MKKRLDHILVLQGLAESRSKAQTMIMTGSVLINNQPVTKSGTMFPTNINIHIKQKLPYVSRGGIKLKGALDHFTLDFQNVTVLDVGASTGGFTDCLLQEGAKHVYCIDVGKNQLHESLQNHPQVTWKESFHVEKLTPETFKQTFAWIVMDVSFISIGKVMPYLVACLEEHGQMLILFKPQFEVERKHLNGGVLKNESIRQQALQNQIDTLTQTYNFKNINAIDSPLKGPKGNQETLLWIQT